MKRRKSTVKVHRTRHPITRRDVLGTLAAGVGTLALVGVTRVSADAGGLPQSQYPQWVNWEDGWAYPIHDIAEDGSWIVKFDDGFFAVDPAGFVYDNAVWFPITEWAPDGVWYSGDDGHDYLLETDLEYIPLDGEDPV